MSIPPNIEVHPNEHMKDLLVKIIVSYRNGNKSQGDQHFLMLKNHYPAFMQQLHPTLKQLIRKVIHDEADSSPASSSDDSPAASESVISEFSSELTSAMSEVRKKKVDKAVDNMSGTLDDLDNLPDIEEN